MKKLACLVLLAVSFWYLAHAGPESLPARDTIDKTVLQPPAQGPTEFFRGHEWDLDIWGTYVFSAHPGHNVPNDDPFTPDLDPEILVSTFFTRLFPAEPKSLNPNERVDVGPQSRDTFLGRDDSWGGGVDAKYFWNKYFGVGVEGFIVDTETELGGAGLVTLTARYPIGRVAPYVFAGLGALTGGGRIDNIFNEQHTYSGGFVTGESEFWTKKEIRNDEAFFDGQLGGGFEVRITPHVGVMTDFAWNFILPDNPDKRVVITSPGGTNFDHGPVTFPNNTAIGVIPEKNGDNKQFGMVRFGLTIDY